MNEFLSFRKMITPILIQVIFWIGVALCVIAGLIGIIGGARADFGGGTQVLEGLLTLLLGPLFVRIYCELLIVIFRIHEELVAIRKGPGGSAMAPVASSPSE